MNGFISSREEIESLLLETKNLISDSNFNINDNFLFIIVRNSDDSNHPKNRETLVELGYDASDVLDEINNLTIQDYYETLPDNRQPGSYLYVFIKVIHNKQIYIKYKIKTIDNKKIVCLSFHFENPELDLNLLPFNCI